MANILKESNMNKENISRSMNKEAVINVTYMENMPSYKDTLRKTVQDKPKKDKISKMMKDNKENYDSNKENTFEKEKMSKEILCTSESLKEPSASKDLKDGDMEKVIHDLRNAYMDMKKERLKTEKDTEHLEHKLKMLQSEETKAYKKFQNEKKFKEEWDQARQKTQDFRKFCNEAKNKKKTETEDMSKKIKEMREYIQRSSNVKKMMKFQENRLSNLQMKQKKIENCELRRSLIKEESLRNRRMAESVKHSEKNFLEKKKIEEDEKKRKVKKDLEEKLMEEQKKKKIFETKLNSLEELESGLMKRMKCSEENSCDKADTKYRSVSTGGSSTKKKKMNTIKAK
jgi:hypothetical protein